MLIPGVSAVNGILAPHQRSSLCLLDTDRGLSRNHFGLGVFLRELRVIRWAVCLSRCRMLLHWLKIVHNVVGLATLESIDDDTHDNRE